MYNQYTLIVQLIVVVLLFTPQFSSWFWNSLEREWYIRMHRRIEKKKQKAEARLRKYVEIDITRFH